MVRQILVSVILVIKKELQYQLNALQLRFSDLYKDPFPSQAKSPPYLYIIFIKAPFSNCNLFGQLFNDYLA